MTTTASQTEFKDLVKSRTRIEEVIGEYGYVSKRVGKDLVCCCMFHTEKSASFKIDTDGQFFKCFGCGKGGDVYEFVMLKERCDFPVALDILARRAGLTRDDATRSTSNTAKIPPARRPAAKPLRIFSNIEKMVAAMSWTATEKHGGKVVAIYKYPESDPQLLIGRIEYFSESKQAKAKQFYQAHAVPGGYSWGGIEGKNPIYNSERVADAGCVVFVEGEKCVKALDALGIVATTTPGGAQSAANADLAPLAGKDVTIWRDFDDPGAKYEADIIVELEKLTPAPSICVVDVAALELGDGGDVCDFLDRVPGDDQSKAFELAEVLGAARPLGALADLHAELDDAMAGRRRAIPFIWSEISRAARANLPGSVCILCGGAGSVKSLCIVENLTAWKKAGVLAVALMLEDGKTYHMRRAMAQIAGNGKLTDDEWCAANPDAVVAARASTSDALQALAHCIESPKHDDPLTVESLLDWIRRKAEAGYRIIAIDPITMMEKGKFGFQDDQRFMTGAKRIIEKHRASLLLVSHPKKAPMKGPPSLSDIAGGAAYERFAAAVLYLKSHSSDDVIVSNVLGRDTVTSNRTIAILKARNAAGAGEKVAMFFDAATLTLKELGVIIPDK